MVEQVEWWSMLSWGQSGQQGGHTCGGQGAGLLALQDGFAGLLGSLAAASAGQHVGRAPRLPLPGAPRHQCISQHLRSHTPTCR